MQSEMAVDEQLDLLGQKTGIEKEMPSEDNERIDQPFDPDNIDVVTKSMTVDLLLSRTASNMIDLQPDFQRRWGVWDAKRQSRPASTGSTVSRNPVARAISSATSATGALS